MFPESFWLALFALVFGIPFSACLLLMCALYGAIAVHFFEELVHGLRYGGHWIEICFQSLAVVFLVSVVLGITTAVTYESARLSVPLAGVVGVSFVASALFPMFQTLRGPIRFPKFCAFVT